MNLDPEVFREAAAALLDGAPIGCCCAITRAAWSVSREVWIVSAYKDYFHELYAPDFDSRYTLYFGDLRSWVVREHRILALLLCAEMLENP